MPQLRCGTGVRPSGRRIRSSAKFVRVFGSGQNIFLQDPVRGCRLLEKALQRSDEFALSVNLAELLPVGRLAAWA